MTKKKTPAAAAAPLPEEDTVTLDKLPDSKTHFILETFSKDWDIILSRLVRTKAVPMNDGFMWLHPPAPPTYFLSKASFTTEELGKALGIDPQVVAVGKVFRLRPLGDQSKWEKPTVDYTGEA